MHVRAKIVICVVLACISLIAEPASAHDSPEHVIDALTELMAIRGESPRLLVSRAYEYRALGELDAAEADLKAALDKAPELSMPRRELARVYLDKNQPENARNVLEEALARVDSGFERANLLGVRAELNEATKKHEAALRDYEEALTIRPDYLDWLLQRSRLQATLGLTSERIDTLRIAVKENASYVLRIELIEALIAGGRYEESLERIERELEDSRWRSSWLVRRARAYLGMEQPARAREDLFAARAEIERRLDPDEPDLWLLIERGSINAMLGRMVDAKHDLQLAREMGAEGWLTAPLERLLQ